MWVDFDDAAEALFDHVDSADGGVFWSCVGQAGDFRVWSTSYQQGNRCKRSTILCGSKLTIFKLDALCLEVLHYRENNRVVLVVWCSVHSFKSIDPWDLLDEAMDISSEFDRTVPFLERKPGVVSSCWKLVYRPRSLHGSKHEPEVSCEELLTEKVLYPHGLQSILSNGRQLH